MMSNTDPFKNRKLSQVIAKVKQFLSLTNHPSCYSYTLKSPVVENLLRSITLRICRLYFGSILYFDGLICFVFHVIFNVFLKSMFVKYKINLHFNKTDKASSPFYLFPKLVQISIFIFRQNTYSVYILSRFHSYYY